MTLNQAAQQPVAAIWSQLRWQTQWVVISGQPRAMTSLGGTP
jgi:hypothetical protein